MSANPAPIGLEARLLGVQDLPTLPVTVQTSLSMLGDSQVSLREVGQLLSTDPVLSARVLRLINSPYYGLRRRLGNVGEAVVYLGRSGTRGLILGSSLLQLAGGDGAVMTPAFWEHSFATAILGRGLAGRLCPERVEEAYLAGLLHDFGQLVLRLHFEKEFSEARRIAAAGAMSQADAETSLLGGSHAEVGSWLGGQWHLPEPVLEAVELHHDIGIDPSDGLLPLCAVVQLADELAHEIGFDGGSQFDGSHSGLDRGAALLTQPGVTRWTPDSIREVAAAEAPDVESLVRMVYER